VSENSFVVGGFGCRGWAYPNLLGKKTAVGGNSNSQQGEIKREKGDTTKGKTASIGEKYGLTPAKRGVATEKTTSPS